jgi:predicted dehydrogenase
MITRRKALESLGLTASGFFILPSVLRGEEAPSQLVNVAMIGTGRQEIEVNFKTSLEMKNVRIVAVCDVNRLCLAYAKSIVDQAYGSNDCRSFSDFREALDMPGLDAVMISSPDHWHATHALMAMKKGLHVCCEKAMTSHFEESRALADMAKKSGVVFRLDSECRSDAYMIKTANLARSGYLGTIRRFEVGVPKEMTEGFGAYDQPPLPHLSLLPTTLLEKVSRGIFLKNL